MYNLVIFLMKQNSKLLINLFSIFITYKMYQSAINQRTRNNR